MNGSQDNRAFLGSRIEALTLDFTHTLARSPGVASIYSEVLGRHGIQLPEADIARHIPLIWQELSFSASRRRDRFDVHGGSRQFWHHFLCRLCCYLDAAEPSRFASSELYARFGQAEAWELYADVLPTLDAARQRGWRIGLISNWDERLPDLVDRLGLADYLDALVYSQALGLEKPHPELFLHCLRELEVEPPRALHVGNHRVEDVEGAVAVGMQAVLVDRSTPTTLPMLLRPWLDPEGGVPNEGAEKP